MRKKIGHASRTFKCKGINDYRNLELSVTFSDKPYGGGIGGQVDFDWRPSKAERAFGLKLAGELFSKVVRLCGANKKLGLDWTTHIRVRKESFPIKYTDDINERWTDGQVGRGRKVIWAECYPSVTVISGMSKADKNYWDDH